MILTMEIARNLKSVSQKLYYAVGAFSEKCEVLKPG